MKKSIIYVGILILFAIIIFSVGIIVGKNINTSKEEIATTKEEIKEEKKIVVATIIVSNNQNNNKNTITSNDLQIDDKMFDTYKQIINSDYIKGKIQQIYKQVNEIELEKVKDTEIIKVVYICDKYSEDECIDIEKMYISEFSKKIEELYNTKVYLVDEPEMSTRIVRK